MTSAFQFDIILTLVIHIPASHLHELNAKSPKKTPVGLWKKKRNDAKGVMVEFYIRHTVL